MKNIAIMIHKLSGGGAERVAANMSIELAKRYNVYLFVFDGTSISYDYSGKIVDFRTPPTDSKIGKCILMLRRVYLSRKFKKQYDIDCTISHLPHNNIINVLSKVKDKIIVVNHHMMSLTENVGTKEKMREQFLARHSYRTVIVSERARIDLIEKYGVDGKKTQTIYNTIDVNSIRNAFKNSESVMVNRNTIVTAGRMADQKGQWHLIRAFSVLHKKYPEARLLILGEGPLKEKLRLLCKKLNIEDAVLMPGFVSNPFAYISKAKFYAFSSNHEGLPMALLEAAACGKASVSTDCDSGCREILAPDTNLMSKAKKIEKDKYGILVPICQGYDYLSESVTDEEKTLAEALEMLYVDDALRCKYENLTENVCERFTPEQIFNEWYSLIEE